MILLTTPYNPGDLDPGKSYTHARISHIGLDEVAKRVDIGLHYGYLVDGEFTWGKVPATSVMVIDDPGHEDEDEQTNWTDLTSIAVINGSTWHQSGGAAVYSYLLSKGILSGEVVQ